MAAAGSVRVILSARFVVVWLARWLAPSSVLVAAHWKLGQVLALANNVSRRLAALRCALNVCARAKPARAGRPRAQLGAVFLLICWLAAAPTVAAAV